MAVGDSALKSFNSYMGVGRETTYGTAVTCTAGLNFMSSSLRATKENKILEQIETSRVYSARIGMGRSVSGDINLYVDPKNEAFCYFLQNALGGSVTSATATGETVGGLAFTHTFNIGDLDIQTYKSLSINERKGDSSAAMVFEYNGLRVNELKLMAEIDDSLKSTVSLIGKDATHTSNDISAAITGIQDGTLSFVNGRLSVESTFASLTSSSYWHVESFEFGIANSLKQDDGRRIGSDTIDHLKQGIAQFSMNTVIRFNTTTAYDAMMAETQLSLELEFLGDTLTTSKIREGIKLQFPVVYVNDAGDPEIGGPDEVLKSTVDIHILKDSSSATGYAMKALVTNDLSSI